MTSIRRSSRASRPAPSIYDEASKAREARASLSSQKSNPEDSDTDSDAESINRREQEEEEDRMQEDSSSSEEESEEEEAAPTRRKRKSPGQAARASKAKANKGRNIRVNLETKTKGRRKASDKSTTSAPTRRAVQTALNSLANKVLDQSETPDNSLVAALLQCPKPSGTNTKTLRGNDTVYTAQLEKIARRVLQQHSQDPNKAQVQLFNLLFRSVGGTVESNLDPDETELEAASEEEWMELVTSVVTKMELTPADCILICANPSGATANNTKTNSVGVVEYRKIYQEFWYTLGRVTLTGNVVGKKSGAADNNGDGSNKDDNDSDTDTDNDNQDETNPSSRFQVELARDLVARLIEMVGVGQPDIRAAAVTAVYQLGAAMLQHTVELQAKLLVASRQLKVAQRAKMSVKANALKMQVDSWKRTIADLEEMIKGTCMGVFMNRYRDTNKFIRADSMQTLSRFSLIRPDMFLVGSYLKYFGWLLSDKDAVVREAALEGLLAPFRQVAKSKGKGAETDIDLNATRSVIEKFLKRIADCVLDVDVQVQERAMELLLILLREDFLDSLDDDQVWQQINLRALAPKSTAAVRRDALYFVIEQLEPFDSGPAKSESKLVECIDGVAQWVAHALSDNEDMPIEKMQIELTDLVVSSLRSMPAHKALVTNWSAMLRAIEGACSNQSGRSKEERRTEGAKKRVLLRMLGFAAELEVDNAAADDDDESGSRGDPDMLAARKAAQVGAEQSTKKRKVGSSKEDFTLALARALPGLLVSYKSETTVLRDLTTLPRYFFPSVFNLPSRKKDFTAILSGLSEVFLRSADVTVLQNCGFALTFLATEDHARSGEAALQLKKVTCLLRDRLIELFKDKADRSSNGDGDDEDSDVDTMSLQDTEHGICLCLRRLSILSKRWDLASLFTENGAATESEKEMDSLCAAVAQVVAKDLQVRKVVAPEDDADEVPETPKIWTTGNAELHAVVAETVSESLTFLVTSIAWRLKSAIAQLGEGDADETDLKENVVVRMRDRLVKLIALCFDQFIDTTDGSESYTAEHIQFAFDVQMHAGSAAGDVRMLFLKAWSDSESPLLRELSLTEEGHLIGGYVRFLRSQEAQLRENEKAEMEDNPLVESLLLPLARGLAANWKLGNRREAGAGLAHITGSGQEASRLVAAMSKVLKKIEPVRLLEAHMACLRQDYEDWADQEPEELADRPSEEEVATFEEGEKAHRDKFGALEHQAARLSASLGVGKLSDKTLVPALLGFVREGVRFAFSTKEQGYDDDLPLGSRLSFLRILSKYLNWIRRDRDHLDILRQDLDRKESELHDHSDFAEVYPDDLAALASFRSAAGFTEYSADDMNTQSIVDEYDTQEPEMSGSVASSLRRRMSSVSSIRSKMSSTQASLSPLYEEDADKDDLDDDGEGSPSQRSVGASVGTSMSVSTLGVTHATIEEGSESSSTEE